jgi:hypothetical protein
VNDDTQVNKDKLWLDEEFRRLYPLSAQRLRDLAVQQQEDSRYRQYIETLRRLHAAADKLSEKEVLELEFSPEDLQGQIRSARVDHQKPEE